MRRKLIGASFIALAAFSETRALLCCGPGGAVRSTINFSTKEYGWHIIAV